jgi:uncharacterized membrane protein (DUF4010 family)
MPSVEQSVEQIAEAFPKDALKIFLVLFLSFLVGFEREGRKSENAPLFGGVRTFPLIGLTGYALALISGGNYLPMSAGLLVVGALMALSYRHKLEAAEEEGTPAGLTTEVTALFTFLIGAIVQQGHYWISATLVVVALLLLELKVALERLTQRIPRNDVLAFTQFLVLTVVILPVVPNQDFEPFHINPFKTWVVVVAVASISFGSYVLQALLKSRDTVLITAVLGGLYSSTATTVSLSRKAKATNKPHLISGAILVAGGVMYVRIGVLVGLFSHALIERLVVPFCALGLVTAGAGALWSRRGDRGSSKIQRDEAKNPLELSAAFLFAALFIAMMVATQLAVTYLGRGGVYGLAAITGVTDVTPFVLGMTQSAGKATTLREAAAAICIASASNTIVKGIYARAFADRKTGTEALLLHVVLAAVGLLPLIWILAS